MKQLFSLLVLMLLSTCSFAQAPNLQWQKSLGGTQTEEANSIQQTKDGGYIVAGSSQSVDGQVTGHHGSASNFDYWVVKLDDTGAIQWETSLGGTLDDLASSVQQTSDGGYVVVGYTESSDGDLASCTVFEYQYFLVKLSATGSVVWKNCFGGLSGSAVNEAFSISQNPDSTFIIGGYTNSGNGGEVSGYHGANDYWAVKVSSTGGFLWSKCLGGSGSDMGKCIQPTTDGGYIMAGYSASTNGQVTGNHGSNDYWVVKLDGTGNLQWEKSLGGSRDDEGKFIRQTYDGGYIVVGASNSTDSQVTGNHGGYDVWAVKLNDTGAIQWEKALGGYGDDWGTSVYQTQDSGYIISAYSDSSSGQVTGGHGANNDYWLVKLSKAGNLQWQKSLGGTGVDEANSVQQTTDSGYIVAGGSTSIDGNVTGNHGNFDYWVAKLSPCLVTAAPVIAATGTLLSTTASYKYYKWELNGTAISGGTNATYSATGAGSYSVFITDSNGCTATSALPKKVGVPSLYNNGAIKIKPNPASGMVYITGTSAVHIGIYSLTGQKLAEAKDATSISVADLPVGLYFIRLWDQDGVLIYQDKILKQ